MKELSYGQWFPLLTPHLPESLVEPSSMEPVEQLARRIPGGVLGAIEIRLGPEPSPVDLSLRLASPAHARQIAPMIETDYLRRFLNDWAEDPDPRIPFLWVEFDLHQPPDADLHPVFIVRLKNPEPQWVVDDLLPPIFPNSTSPEWDGAVRRCLDNLPEPGNLVYVFNLESRGQKAVRLDFFGLSPSKMQTYFERLERPDLSAAIAAPLKIVENAERFHLNFDVDGEIQPRIGIEASYGVFPKRDTAWGDLFDRLVEAKLCTPEKRDAVFSWPGYTSPNRAGDRWPMAPHGPEGFLVRSISHVKLVCQPGQPPEAKVYLLFGLHVRNAQGKLMPSPD